MNLFNDKNTEGYSELELNALNAEWEKIVEQKGIEEFTEEFNIEAKKFTDVVANR